MKETLRPIRLSPDGALDWCRELTLHVSMHEHSKSGREGKKHTSPAFTATFRGALSRARDVLGIGGGSMNEHSNGQGYECLVIDLNTQHDFCDPDGAAAVDNIPELIPTLRRVVAWVRRNYAPVVSSIESHRPFELSDSGTPICCVDGSGGQHKLDFTIFPHRRALEVDNSLSLPIDIFQQVQQVIFRKRSDDLLANPKADRLFSHVPVAEYIIFGSGLETSVKALALALRARAKSVSVVTDACGYWGRAAADLAMRQMTAKGTNLITVDELVTRKLEGRYQRRRRWDSAANGGTAVNRNGRAKPTSLGRGAPTRPIPNKPASPQPDLID